MHRLVLAVALFTGGIARGDKGDKPYQPDEEEDGPAQSETIQPGKRPELKLTGKASEEKGKAPKEAKEEIAPPPQVPTSYKGVTPGAQNLPPRAPRLPVKGPAKMTWPGFQVRDGVPTVFVELTGAVEWSVSEEPGQLVYTLKDTEVHLRNNRRPLKVKEFGTAVKEVDARPKGRDVRVTISLKQKMAHKERTEEAAGGFKLLLVELSPL